MDSDLYSMDILKLAASISRIGRLEAPDVSVQAHSPVCGSRITVHLRLEDDVVAGYAQEVEACLIGQAVASVVGRAVVGLTVEDVHEGAAALRGLLSDRKPPGPGPWGELEAFLPVADVPSRHASALLPFDALERALARIARAQAN